MERFILEPLLQREGGLAAARRHDFGELSRCSERLGEDFRYDRKTTYGWERANIDAAVVSWRSISRASRPSARSTKPSNEYLFAMPRKIAQGTLKALRGILGQGWSGEAIEDARREVASAETRIAAIRRKERGSLARAEGDARKAGPEHGLPGTQREAHRNGKKR